MSFAPAHQDSLDAGKPAPRKAVLPFPVVGIGGSAGGLAATLRLFEHMPGAPGMAFVVVLHLSPEHESSAAAILQRSTRMPVQQVTQRLRLEQDQVYVIAPGMQLSLDDGHLDVQVLERQGSPPFSIDSFFRSLAQAQGARAIAVVLSGMGSDGAMGLRDVRAAGGVTLAQAPQDAEFDGMPLAAITTQRVDFVLPAAEMADKLIALTQNARCIELPGARAAGLPATKPAAGQTSAQAEAALQAVMALLHSRTGHSFQHYKRGTVLRRLERRMQVTRQPSLGAYRDYLEGHPEETGALLQDMLISVTSFFRDRVAFEALERELVNGLLSRRPAPSRLRVWSVGCATGEEAYSLAMLLGDHAPQSLPGGLQVFASDIDERALAVARAAVYPQGIAADVPSMRLRQYFQKEGDAYRVRKELREQVTFALHNVLRDPPFSRLDVISCRNLLIYLEREAQQRVLEIFHFALNPGGVLFLGSAESADALPQLFTPIDKKQLVYKANPNPAQRARRELLPLLPDALRVISPPAPVQAHPVAPLAHLHERVLYEQAPASVLVDAQYKVLHTGTGTACYLCCANDVPSQLLLEMVRPELVPVLRPALLHAAHTGHRVAAAPVRLRLDQAEVLLHISVRPGTGEGFKGKTFLVTFDEFDDSLALTPGSDAAARDPTRPVLEEELRRLQARLQGSLGVCATSDEQLRAANEELQSLNEALRCVAEDVETSKEELQSANEELITVNFELKRKVDELTRVNDDLSNLIASIDIATVFVDRALRIKRFTPQASGIFSLLANDVGRSLLDITHCLEYDTLREDMVRVFERLQPLAQEVRSRDGHWYLMRISPYRTNEDRIEGVVLNFIDVSERRQAQEQLRAREERLRLVAESTRDFAILTCDAEGRITTWNHGAERLFGWSEAEALGQSLDMTFTPEDVEAGVPGQERGRARDTGRSEDERWHWRKDGSRFFCSGVTTAFHDGSTQGFAKIARDFTERRLLDKQREQVLQAKQQVGSQLEAATALRSEFLAILSHELKNPLNLILMSTELLSRSVPALARPPASRAIDTIRRTVHAQSQIIDDLLDLSRINTGKLSLTRTAVQGRTDIESIVEALRPEARARQVEMAVEVEDLVLHADSVRLQQIVWNLVSNALKFTPPGGRVAVRLVRDEACARLEVSDTGCGIEPSLLERVFDMFVQGDGAPTTRCEGGLGIGLALVKQLAELHGGRVQAQSPGPGRGATFSVWMPLHECSLDSEAAQPASASPLSGRCVLLVEDNPDTLESLQMLLELQGARVTPAVSAAVALQEAAENDFDLLVSDIAMPGMDGLQLIAELRRRPRSARWPAIAVTGFAGEADAQRARAAGFDAHLGKPLSLEALSEAFERINGKGIPG
ncbi:CheR family methyltransferase [Azohydromonas caseinilytica]|uniref:PAS domain S-box protein n=1 Tax=Azohydromonas caseinilytica TaxID=2728836 RepID=A0A848FD11_9BURK|nr:CheR family methyltransferase [Azohydromonas caseinilytica]NML17354.1 PAS domain S-box protein [Azohydromonas caseinilytica]